MGWKFVGPTTVYAFMQAMGLINDHVPDCVIRSKVDHARKSFRATRALTNGAQFGICEEGAVCLEQGFCF